MYSIVGILFCILEGFLVAKFGWIALIWSSLGMIFSLFVSANIILPILLGVPMASAHISKKEMRPMVFLALLRAPIIWTTLFFLFGWIFPTAVEWVSKNETLCIGLAFGFVVILFSPLSKKARTDFRSDFNKSYGRYYTDQNNSLLGITKNIDRTQLKQAEAVIKIASNLYYHDFVNALDILIFQFPDSRFRCLIFSLSATVKSCEDLLKSPELIRKECLLFLSNFVTSKEQSKEFFDHQTNYEQAEKYGTIYLDTYTENWRNYDDIIKKGDKAAATTILCSMLHSLEAEGPLENSDKERLNQLCWQIEFSLTHNIMRDAFVSLISK